MAAAERLPCASRVDRKTVARYVAAAKQCGLKPGDEDGILTAEVVGAVAQRVPVGAPVQTGSGHALCVEHSKKLLAWRKFACVTG